MNRKKKPSVISSIPSWNIKNKQWDIACTHRSIIIAVMLNNQVIIHDNQGMTGTKGQISLPELQRDL